MMRKISELKSFAAWCLHSKDRIRGFGYRKKNTSNPVRVIVFLCNYPQGWNSLKTVFEASLKNKSFKTYLVAYVDDSDTEKKYELFWKNIDNNVIISKHNRIYDVEKIKPDIVFMQRPYKDTYPVEYSFKNIARFSKIYYVPYAYNSSPEKHLQIEYNYTFFNYVYAIFADNHTAACFCKKKKKRSRFYSNIKIYECGFPRFDLLNVDISKTYANYLWIPRWSLDSQGNDSTGFFEYVNCLIEFFEGRPSVRLMIRPHPLMFSNFVAKGAMSEIEVYDFERKIESIPNIFLDSKEDYIPAFEWSDVLIADFSSLDVEYAVTGKPIIYCGDIREFNNETRQMTDCFYIAHDANQLINRITMLADGNDPHKQNRIRVANIFKRGAGSDIGKKIIKICTGMEKN